MSKRLPGWIAIAALPVSALAEYANFLKHVPGGNVNRNGPLTGIAQFRDLYGERVNLLTNQMALKPACTNAMDDPASHIPSALFKSVTVYREVTPVSTGLETWGGSILMESRASEFTEIGVDRTGCWAGQFANRVYDF